MLSFLRRAVSVMLKGLTVVVMVAVGVELVCFLVVSGINLAVYGKIREGSRVVYDPYVIFANKDGLRPTTGNAPEGLGRPVWMFGGSTMRGATEDPSRTIPSFLAAQLNKTRPRFELINFGENSYNTLMEAKRFQKACINQPQDPAWVVFYDGANDATYFSQYHTPRAHQGYRRLSGMVESYHDGFFGVFKALNAAIRVSFARELYDKITMALVPLSANDPELIRFTDEVERRYRYLAREARFRGAGFVVFWQPTRWTETGASEASHRFLAFQKNISLVYATLRERLRGYDWFVPLSDVLVGQEGVYTADGVHLTDRGRELVAQAMYRVLDSRGM